MTNAEAIEYIKKNCYGEWCEDDWREAMDMAIEALKCSETPKSSERTSETAQADHTADISKKVSISCGQENGLISRKAAIDALRSCQTYLFDAKDPDKKIELRSAELAIEGLSPVQPETHWIPCSERLPERADNVIICYKAGDYTLVSTGRYLYKFKMWYVDVVGDLRDGVTAWMPMPDPYRGGEKDDR